MNFRTVQGEFSIAADQAWNCDVSFFKYVKDKGLSPRERLGPVPI